MSAPDAAPRRRLVAACLRVLLSGALLAGCAEQPQGQPTLTLRPVGYDALDGWQDDPASILLPALLQQCRRLALLPQDALLGGAGAVPQGSRAAGQATGPRSAWPCSRFRPAATMPPVR